MCMSYSLLGINASWVLLSGMHIFSLALPFSLSSAPSFFFHDGPCPGTSSVKTTGDGKMTNFPYAQRLCTDGQHRDHPPKDNWCDLPHQLSIN